MDCYSKCFLSCFSPGGGFFLHWLGFEKNESLSTDNHWYRMNRFIMLFKFDCDIRNGWKDVCDEVALLRWDDPFSRRLNFLSFSFFFSPLLIRASTLLLKASKSPKRTHKMISQRVFSSTKCQRDHNMIRAQRELSAFMWLFWSTKEKLYRLFRQ